MFFSKIRELPPNTESAPIRNSSRRISKNIDFRNRPAADLIDSLSYLKKIQTTYKDSIENGYISKKDLQEIYSVVSTHKYFKEGILQHYDWKKYAENSIAEICAEANEHDKTDAVNG